MENTVVAVEKKRLREEAEQKKKLRIESQVPQKLVPSENVKANKGFEDEIDKGEDYGCPSKRVKKPDLIPLLVPRMIVQTVALNSKRWL